MKAKTRLTNSELRHELQRTNKDLNLPELEEHYAICLLGLRKFVDFYELNSMDDLAQQMLLRHCKLAEKITFLNTESFDHLEPSIESNE